jgi:hypothetical protein
VEDAGIVGVEPVAYEPPSGCELVDYRDATLLPGLIDTHVHLVGDSGVMALERAAGYSWEEIDDVVVESLRCQLAVGVTTVRNLGDRRFNVVERRDGQRQIDDGLPCIVASGPPITVPGGYCGYLLVGHRASDESLASVGERGLGLDHLSSASGCGVWPERRVASGGGHSNCWWFGHRRQDVIRDGIADARAALHREARRGRVLSANNAIIFVGGDLGGVDLLGARRRRRTAAHRQRHRRLEGAKFRLVKLDGPV